ncbi:hypothetical protein HYZ97_00680 [Candidatus Pacearchaeota archaeon]|nr:hypothetical protein [Candidatus Pacearchaeota archaeon]
MNNIHTMNELNQNVIRSNTSLVGIKCKDGVVIGADRRATAGSIIMSKTSRKVVPVNDYLITAGTGLSSDIDLHQKIIAAELRLKHLKTRSRPSVKESANMIAMMIYRHIRTPSMIPGILGLLVGGVDENGESSLYTIEPAGGVYEVNDFDANFSSGMPYILGLLERQYKKEITVKEAIELAKEALKASTQRDVGSGNGIDIYTITKSGITQAVSEEIVPQYK